MLKPIALVGLLSLSTQVMAAPAKPKAATLVTVAVEGDVLKPGLYEIKSGAELKAVLALAGGLVIKPTAARVTIERGPNHKLSWPTATVLRAKQQPAWAVKLQANDYIYVDTQPSGQPDPLLLPLPGRKARVVAPPGSSSFQFNGTTVYLIPVPGPH